MDTGVLSYILAAAIGYLLGHIQFAVILSKHLYKDDVRNHGSGNAGSTNMLRVFGLKPGLTTFVGDFSKGILAVLVGRWLGGETGAYVCAFFTVLGHDFPAFLHFRGGKGVASTFAVFWMLNPLLGGIITALALVLLFATRMVAVASLLCALVYVTITAIFYFEQPLLVATVGLLCLLIVLRHTENIKRILKGEESRLFDKKKTAA